MNTEEKDNVVEENVETKETEVEVNEEVTKVEEPQEAKEEVSQPEAAVTEEVKESPVEEAPVAPTEEVQTNIFGLPEEKEEKVEEPTPVEEPKEEQPKEEPEPIVNAEINGTEKVVFEYKKQKEMGPLPVFIFFAFMALLIAFLPSIQKYIKDYQNGKITITGSKTEETPETSEAEEPEPETIYYDFSADTTISINRLTLTNFKKNDDILKKSITFNVSNKDNKEYSFDENIFIEFYNVNKTLLSRILIESDENLKGSSAMDLTLGIDEQTFSELSKIVIKQIDKNDYTSITLNENLKDQQEYQCILDDQKIIYTFKDYKLLSIDDQIVKQRENYQELEKYQEDMLAYKQKANNENTITGLTASVIDDTSKFSYAVKIDLAHITESDLKSLKSRSYYSKDTEAKIIAFEMQARGYSCKAGSDDIDV